METGDPFNDHPDEYEPPKIGDVLSSCPYAPGSVNWKTWQQDFIYDVQYKDGTSAAAREVHEERNAAVKAQYAENNARVDAMDDDMRELLEEPDPVLSRTGLDSVLSQVYQQLKDDLMANIFGTNSLLHQLQERERKRKQAALNDTYRHLAFTRPSGFVAVMVGGEKDGEVMAMNQPPGPFAVIRWVKPLPIRLGISALLHDPDDTYILDTELLEYRLTGTWRVPPQFMDPRYGIPRFWNDPYMMNRCDPDWKHRVLWEATPVLGAADKLPGDV